MFGENDNDNEQVVQQYYKTSDLGLATALSLNFSIRLIDNSNPRKVVFMFLITPVLTDFIDKYWRGEISVEPQAFFSQIKNLKTRIYSSEQL